MRPVPGRGWQMSPKRLRRQVEYEKRPTPSPGLSLAPPNPAPPMQSMTGFGRAAAQADGFAITVEVRAVNARQADVRVKVPTAYRDEEPALRKALQEASVRGKVDAVVERRAGSGAALETAVDPDAYAEMRRRLRELEPALAFDPVALATAVLRMPSVYGAGEVAAAEAELEALHEAFAEAVRDFVGFRQNEGRALAVDIRTHVEDILATVPQVEDFEPEREERMRERLERLIEDKLSGTALERNRLEQEALYYLEKMDISEEKQRLRQHCRFFLESMADDELEKGRRLSFIAQEMGREINTLGAKAYSSDIQRVVVHMKDELEKVKEQLANVI